MPEQVVALSVEAGEPLHGENLNCPVFTGSSRPMRRDSRTAWFEDFASSQKSCDELLNNGFGWNSSPIACERQPAPGINAYLESISGPICLLRHKPPLSFCRSIQCGWDFPNANTMAQHCIWRFEFFCVKMFVMAHGVLCLYCCPQTRRRSAWIGAANYVAIGRIDDEILRTMWNTACRQRKVLLSLWLPV